MSAIKSKLGPRAIVSLLGAVAFASAACAATALLKVSDQKMKGADVSIAEANLPSNGFIVINDSDSSGKMIDHAIGEVALKAGDHKAVQVKITGTHKAGETLWAVVHDDTGAAGVYEYGMPGKSNVDMPMKNGTAIVEGSFKLQ